MIPTTKELTMRKLLLFSVAIFFNASLALAGGHQEKEHCKPLHDKLDHIEAQAALTGEDKSQEISKATQDLENHGCDTCSSSGH